MLLRTLLASLSMLLLVAVISACKHDIPEKAVVPEVLDNYPPQIAAIIRSNCAVAGCHNAASYQVSGGGLLMDTWEHLFDGGSHGATVVPYSPENSSLLYFTNSFPEFGPIPEDQSMRMPLNAPALSKDDYITLRNWITNGAPDKFGNVPFASNAATRQKIYAVHQGCDYVTVIDAEKHVVMRMIPIGKLATIETAHSIKVSSDGYAYISLWASQHVIKIDTRTDSVVDDINIGSPNSNMLQLTPNGNELLITNWFSNALLRLDVSSKQILGTYGLGAFLAPHGIATNKSADTFFVTEMRGNIVHRIPLSGGHRSISIDGTPPSTGAGKPDPHNIQMAPDYSKYFLSCEGSNEIRVMDAHSDTLIAKIDVGGTPQEMAISRAPLTPYLFVTCLDDPNTKSIHKGSVYIINYKTHEFVRRIADRYYMPHAITLDDQRGILYVFSRNIDTSGPQPHHNSSVCEGRSGFYSIYNFKTLQPVNEKRYEVTVDPYSAATRFE